MTDGIPVGEDDLQAYVDGRLAPERRDVVATYLAAHPDQTLRLAQLADQQKRLRDALQAKFEEPVPNRLRIVSLQSQHQRSVMKAISRAAVIALMTGLGVAGGWAAHGWTAGEDSLGAANRNATAAFNTFSVEIRHPVEVRADDGQHLVQWLSTRLQRKLNPPDLNLQGFRLMGGRVVPTAGSPAALLMYDNDVGVRLTVYVQPMRIESDTFRTAEQGNVQSIYWAERKLAVAVTGRMPQATLLALARSIYDQMDRAESATRL